MDYTIGREVSALTVYADVLFLVNFSMDILTLNLACAVGNRPLRRGRILSASLIGALSATAAVVLRIPEFAAAVGGIAVSGVMAALTFGCRGAGRLFRDTAAVWGAGCLLGGVMTALSGCGEPVFSGGDGYPAAYLVCAAVSFLWTRLRRGSAVGEARTVRVRIEAAGFCAEFTGLCDTGSGAADPIGGLPAILVKRKALPELADLLVRTAAGEKTGRQVRLRMIPVRGVGGERLLCGFLPEKVRIGDTDVAAAVAVDPEEENGPFPDGYAGADALVPGALCRGG